MTPDTEKARGIARGIVEQARDRGEEGFVIDTEAAIGWGAHFIADALTAARSETPAAGAEAMREACAKVVRAKATEYAWADAAHVVDGIPLPCGKLADEAFVMEKAIRALPLPAVPAGETGWRLVPPEPDFNMVMAARSNNHGAGQMLGFYLSANGIKSLWQAMLAAAPLPAPPASKE